MSRGDYGGGYGGGYEQRLAAAAGHRSVSSSMAQPPSPSLDRRLPQHTPTASAAGSREVQDYAEKKRQQMQRAEEIKRERNSIKKDDASGGANRLGQRNIPATPGDIFGPRPNAGPTPNACSAPANMMDDGYGAPPAAAASRGGRMDESTRDRAGGMPPRGGAPPAASTPSNYGSRREAAFDSRDTRGGGPPPRRPVDRYDDGDGDRGDGARMLSGPPPSHSRVGSASSTASGRGGGGGGGSDDGYDGGRVMSATTRPRPATREMNGPTSAQPSRSGGYGGGSSSSSGGDSVLLKRIEALEEEVRLLRHQNQLFVNFMQKTEQQMSQLSRSSSSSSAAAAKKPPMGGSGSSSARSDSAGSVSSRDGGKLKTAEERDPARRGAPPAADPRSRARVGGMPPARDDTYDDEQDDGDHPSEDEEERRALERAKSAKQREIDRINQRKKAGPPGGPAASSVPMPANGRGMAVASGGAGVKSGPSSHLRAAVDEPLDDEDRPLTGARNASYDEGEMEEGDEGEVSFRGGNGVPDDPYAEVGELKDCPHCGRHFTDINLARHLSKKVCQKKRKVFDMKKQRLEGELKAAIVSAGLTKPAAKKASAAADAAKSEKKAKWRADRERLQEAIRAGKQIQKAVAEGIDPSTLPIAQSKVEDDRTPCPHCGRKFAATTAERHIPHCANTKNRPGGPPGARGAPAKGRR